MPPRVIKNQTPRRLRHQPAEPYPRANKALLGAHSLLEIRAPPQRPPDLRVRTLVILWPASVRPLDWPPSETVLHVDLKMLADLL
jgi:hypothetical protein